MKIAPNTPCPCGNPTKYKRCCGPLHKGVPAPSPEALMRSRYSAYVARNVAYILRTTHPDGPHWESNAARWAESVEHFCTHTEFGGLTIRETGDMATGDAWVTFEARLQQNGVDTSFVERSLFRKADGHWLYHSGVHEAAE